MRPDHILGIVDEVKPIAAQLSKVGLTKLARSLKKGIVFGVTLRLPSPLFFCIAQRGSMAYLYR